MKPSVAAIVPTYDSAALLPLALGSLAAQRYEGRVEVVCVDGGSTDGTLEVARRHGARVLANPRRSEEEARAIGIDATESELVLLLDADDELPHEGWLDRLVSALDLAPDLVAADCLYHAWRPGDPPLTRLAGLIGGVDPLAVELGFADRWAHHLGRWTGMPVEEEAVGEALLVRIDPVRPPPLGSNGFLVRRGPLLETGYRPFVHSDVAGDLAAAGWRFARVREEIAHHHAADLRAYARKARRRARRAVRGEPPQRRGFRPPRLALARAAASSLLLAGPAVRAARGYRRRPDRAWALYPVVSWLATSAYVVESLARVTGRNPGADV